MICHLYLGSKFFLFQINGFKTVKPVHYWNPVLILPAWKGIIFKNDNKFVVSSKIEVMSFDVI